MTYYQRYLTEKIQDKFKVEPVAIDPRSALSESVQFSLPDIYSLAGIRIIVSANKNWCNGVEDFSFICISNDPNFQNALGFGKDEEIRDTSVVSLMEYLEYRIRRYYDQATKLVSLLK